MINSLISREAAIAFANDQIEKETGAYSKGRNAGIRIMKSALNNPDAIPSVAAVPLDKLCEYLNSVIYPCIICKESPGPQCNAKRKGCWDRVLTKWMEEQDA